jgi:serine/threonine-protein kinase
MIGSVLSQRYRIDTTIGFGPKVVVYRAHDLSLGRDVAVKTLAAPALGPQERARLLTEAQGVAGLNRPLERRHVCHAVLRPA